MNAFKLFCSSDCSPYRSASQGLIFSNVEGYLHWIFNTDYLLRAFMSKCDLPAPSHRGALSELFSGTVLADHQGVTTTGQLFCLNTSDQSFFLEIAD